MDKNTITVGDFNTPWTSMDRFSRQKNNKATETLNDTTDQLDLTDIYRTPHPKNSEYTPFSSTQGMFSIIDQILDHKTSLNKFKRIEIVSSIFSDHDGMNLAINYRKKSRKHKDVKTKQYTNKKIQQVNNKI